jgi:hypothetical protein
MRSFKHPANAAAFALIAFVIVAVASRPAAHDRISKVTWTTDVAPILHRRCLTCHSPGGFGPMSLATYDDARSWAKGIREEVQERRMPPWPAARGFGDFQNDRSLTAIEVELLTAWADGGTPIGPPVVPVSESEEIAGDRSPDLMLTAPAPHSVSSSTVRVELATRLATSRWLAGWEFKPGNRSIVEQAVVLIAPATRIGTWTPGDPAMIYPAGIAQRLPAGARLVLEIRYRKSATPQTDQSGIALYFGGKPKRELRHRALPCGTTAIAGAMEVLAVTPRASAAGASIEVVARRRDGPVEPLTVLPRYEPAYPISYRYRTGVPLRAGTLIDVRSSEAGCAAMLDYVGGQ